MKAYARVSYIVKGLMHVEFMDKLPEWIVIEAHLILRAWVPQGTTATWTLIHNSINMNSTSRSERLESEVNDVMSYHVSIEMWDVHWESHQSISQSDGEIHVQVVSPSLKHTMSAGGERNTCWALNLFFTKGFPLHIHTYSGMNSVNAWGVYKMLKN